jgi:hypothetical protein
MKKYFSGGLILPIILFMLYLPRAGADSTFDEKVRQAIESLKSRAPVKREKFVDIDIKKVRFPHRKHQQLIKEMGESCAVCHHKRKERDDPRACRKCHFDNMVVSKGKYGRVGQKLSQSDVFHLSCGDCHKRMLQDGYRRADGSPAAIPSKCHHCHLIKEK